MEGAVKLEYEIERENIRKSTLREKSIWTRSTGSEEIFRKRFLVFEGIPEIEGRSSEDIHLFLVK